MIAAILAGMISPAHPSIEPLLRERRLSMHQARAFCPGHPAVATLWRWRNRGVRGVRLETFPVGGRVYTTREALLRFLSAIKERPPRAEAAQPRSPDARARQIDAARARLQSIIAVRKGRPPAGGNAEHRRLQRK